MDSQVSRLRLLGLLFCLTGGFAITFGWAGTAQVTCVDCQVPYLISGGAAGLALTIVGTGLLVIAQLRVEGNRIAQRLAPPATEAADRETGRDAPARPAGPAAGPAPGLSQPAGGPAPGSAQPAGGPARPGEATTEPLAIADRDPR